MLSTKKIHNWYNTHARTHTHAHTTENSTMEMKISKNSAITLPRIHFSGYVAHATTVYLVQYSPRCYYTRFSSSRVRVRIRFSISLVSGNALVFTWDSNRPRMLNPRPLSPLRRPSDTRLGLWRRRISLRWMWSTSKDSRSMLRETLDAKLVTEVRVPAKKKCKKRTRFYTVSTDSLSTNNLTVNNSCDSLRFNLSKCNCGFVVMHICCIPVFSHNMNYEPCVNGDKTWIQLRTVSNDQQRLSYCIHY